MDLKNLIRPVRQKVEKFQDTLLCCYNIWEGTWKNGEG